MVFWKLWLKIFIRDVVEKQTFPFFLLLYLGIIDQQNNPLITTQKTLCSNEATAVLRERRGGEERGG